MDTEQAKLKFEQRIQRCYGCFVAFYLKDMRLAEGGTFCAVRIPAETRAKIRPV